jgi:hypothetical protein
VIAVKTKKPNNEKKSQAAKISFPCGDFQKMAEMMKSCCPGEGDIMDCCSLMKRMMSQRKEARAKETKETQKRPSGRKIG